MGGVGAPEGVMTLPGAMSGAVVDRVGGLKGLRGLDLTLCAVGVEGLGRVVRAGGGRGLRVLSVAVEIEGREWWGGVFEGLSGGVGLEVVEVVGRPRGEVVEVMMVSGYWGVLFCFFRFGLILGDSRGGNRGNLLDLRLTKVTCL